MFLTFNIAVGSVIISCRLNLVFSIYLHSLLQHRCSGIVLHPFPLDDQPLYNSARPRLQPFDCASEIMLLPLGALQPQHAVTVVGEPLTCLRGSAKVIMTIMRPNNFFKIHP
jgi:hypothetical protein